MKGTGQTIPFVKACALGNDFVIISDPISEEQATLSVLSKKLADRRWGVGCDQVIYVRPANEASAYQVRFFNADGSEAEACGNGSRCVAKLLIQQHDLENVTLKTLGGILECNLSDDDIVSIVLPLPLCIKAIDIKDPNTPFMSAVFVDIGNPHLVCFVDDITVAQNWGPMLETRLHEIDPTMPPRVNVGFAKVADRNTILLSVWERGSGFTEACGTGACAAAVACHAQDLVDQRVYVDQKGGRLIVQINEQDLLLQGEAYLVYKGIIPNLIFK